MDDRTPELGLAVLPFQVRGAPGFDFLRDGLVELISAGIGGDGISRVPPTAVFGHVDRGEEAGSPAQRARLARDLGADLVLAGEVTVQGDTMRISAALFDGRKPERPVRRVEVSGGTAEVPALAQRLALAVNPASRAHAPSPTAAPSLPALKLYITGQRLLKRHQYDSARAAFAGATREDPSYALAHFGLVVALEASNRPAEADAAAARAMALGGQLPERERNLLVARDAYRAGDAASAEQAARAVIARDGHDVDAWAILGETELRLNPLRGRPAAEARQAFEVVLALEPARREAAFHLAELAAMRRDWSTVVKLGRSMLSAEPDSRRSVQLRVLTRAGETGGTVDSSSIRSIVMGADDGMAFGAARTLAVVLRDLPAAIAVLRPIEERARTPAARAYAALLVAQLELARGRWRAAETELARARKIDALRAANYEALLVTAPGLPHDRGRLRTARRHLADAAAQPVPINADPPDWAAPEAELAGLLYPYLDGRLGALLGDGTALARVAELNEAGENGSLAEHYALIVRAALDPAADPLPSGVDGVAPDRAVLSPFYSLPEARYTHAERLARSGELELANAWFASLEELSIPDLVFGAPAHLRQAQIARALGRPREAALHYQAFLSLWKDADAELQPLVRSAERSFATVARQ